MSAALNPRYVAYMSAHLVGDPALMATIDRERFPGGHVIGFINWNNARIRQWIALRGHGSARYPDLYLHMHGDDYDAWLLGHFPPLALAGLLDPKVVGLALLNQDVCFAHQPDGPAFRVMAVGWGGMVMLHGMAGEFAPHLFVVKADTAIAKAEGQ